MDEHPSAIRYPALAIQRAMVLQSLRSPTAGVNIQQITLDWGGTVDRVAFTDVWRGATARHDALRTSFGWDGDAGLTQVVAAAVEPRIRWVTGSVGQMLAVDRCEPFDLSSAPLVRVTVIGAAAPAAGSNSVHDAVLVTFHHSILDGRSTRMLVDELLTEYADRVAGRAGIAPSRPRFAEFVRWFGEVDHRDAAGFWSGYLAGASVGRSLPGLLSAGLGPRPDEAVAGEAVAGEAVAGEAAAVPAVAGPGIEEALLTRAESDEVRAAASLAGVGLSTVVTAAWGLLRARYGGVDDAVFAVTRSCRYGSVEGADDILGVLINTVPLRIRIDPKWTVAQLLTDVAARIRAVREHQLSPLSSILEWAGLPPDAALLDSLVLVEHQRLHTALSQSDAASPDQIGMRRARESARLHRLPSHPYTLYAFDEPQLCLTAIWDRGRLLDASAKRMLVHARATILELARHPDAPLDQLDLGAAAERSLLAAWGTGSGGSIDVSLPELFARQVAERPDAPAVVDGDTIVTYAQLDAQTDRIAWALRRRGVGADTLVAVALARGAALIQVLLAILKAGGAYLSLDLASPAARIAGILADSGARLVLASAATAESLARLDSLTVVDAMSLLGEVEPLDGPSSSASSGPTLVRPHPLNLAYVCYTSGSTGAPKGVAVVHRAIVRLVHSRGFAELGPGERLLQLAPIAFDASTLEVWGALLTGAAVVVAPPDPVDLRELAALLRSGAVTCAWLTAGLFQQLAELDAGALAGPKQVLTGGDVIDSDAVRAVLRARGGRRLVNGYGPTENTTFTTCQVIDGTTRWGDRVPIGRPVGQTSVRVLDSGGHPVAIGVAGELYAGGDGLARGYLGSASATAAAFVPDPSGGGGRLYRTGDVVRWRADGILEFLGRLDQQVKIRGFRVEPGEVEAVLSGLPEVGAAAVAVRGDGLDRHLVAYVTAATQAGVESGVRPAERLDPAAVIAYLAQRLPGYLVPSAVVVLDRLPLTPNGKVDRSALPRPAKKSTKESAQEPAAESAAAQSATEEQVLRLWRALLPEAPERIGRAESFFALGGNSLNVARLMFRVAERFGVQLRLSDFYQAPTLAATAAAIDAAIAREPMDRPSAGPTIRRRERSLHQVDSRQEQPQALADHLIPLTDRWALWRTVCLRSAGFPVDLVATLADPRLAEAADAVNAAQAGADLAATAGANERYAAEFPQAVLRHSHALHAIAGDAGIREAVAWQNPHALATGIDSLQRRDPTLAVRNTKHRQHETLVATYLQRYCTKNDTIGFFGPVCWATFADGDGLRIAQERPWRLLARRRVYLEGWAVAAVMAPHTAELRPWLVPRRMPFHHVSGTTLRVPQAPPVRLTPAEAAVLLACDGELCAHEVAERLLADPTAGFGSAQEVYDVLDELGQARRIAWRVEVAPHDALPELAMRSRLALVTDETVRTAASASLTRLCSARDELAESAGDAQRVMRAMTGLESVFTQLSGSSPSRRAGAMYAGRTLAYEECLRSDQIQFGASTLDNARAALGLVLDSARWFTAAGAALYRRVFDEIYQRRCDELGTAVVPFVDFWLRLPEVLFDPPESMVGPIVRALQRRWAAVLPIPEGQRRVRLAASSLAPAVAEAFGGAQQGWPTAIQHSPDLMLSLADPTVGLAAGHEWVLGELHPGVNTLRYNTWVAYHDLPDALRAAMSSDVGGVAVYPAETGEYGGVPTRQSNVFVGDHDLRLIFAHDSFGHDPRRALLVGECDLYSSPTGLRVRQRDGLRDLDVMAVLGDLVGAGLAQRFRMLAPSGHTPRVTIDSLVVSRESWTFPAAELEFARTSDEAQRFRQVRSWATERGLPRHLFFRSSGERKPMYADLTSLASVDLICRSVRRARQHSADQASVTVAEMLPAPDQLWLADPRGRRYAAELRVVAVDRKMG